MPPRTNRQKSHIHFREGLIAFLGYGLLVTAMTWPVISNLSTQLIGGHVDQWTHLWTFEWIKQSLLTGTNPFYTDIIFYPTGVSLGTHNIAWLNILLWLPLQTIVGGIAAYNLVFLAVLAFNGLAVYIFAYDLTASRLAAVIGGLICALWPCWQRRAWRFGCGAFTTSGNGRSACCWQAC